MPGPGPHSLACSLGSYRLSPAITGSLFETNLHLSSSGSHALGPGPSLQLCEDGVVSPPTASLQVSVADIAFGAILCLPASLRAADRGNTPETMELRRAV